MQNLGCSIWYEILTNKHASKARSNYNIFIYNDAIVTNYITKLTKQYGKSRRIKHHKLKVNLGSMVTSSIYTFNKCQINDDSVWCSDEFWLFKFLGSLNLSLRNLGCCSLVPEIDKQHPSKTHSIWNICIYNDATVRSCNTKLTKKYDINGRIKHHKTESKSLKYGDVFFIYFH